VAVRGEFPWPSLGRLSGRPRGILVTACGEKLMAVDTLRHGFDGDRSLLDPSPVPVI
jgi:hypothetical protein